MERGGNKNEQMGNIWDVVVYLARALTDARDQLVGLINFPGNSVGSDRKVNRFKLRHVNGIPQQHGKGNWQRDNGFQDVRVSNALARCRGGGPNWRPMECDIPASNKVKNIHRQHARGHVAFGVHSEFKPQPPNHKPVNRCISKGPSTGSKCKRGGRKKGVEIGVFLDPKTNCLQINTTKGEGNPVNIKFIPNNPCQPCPPPCTKDPFCTGPPSPDSKRHCIGTQYAELLREEAFSLRERRLAEDLKEDSRPKWTRC